MARIIGGSMIGELSGKLGGNVFARNKSGAYIRQYVIPVNPNTEAQIAARTSFGTVSSSYHALNSVEKNQWQSFAQNLYLPKNGLNSGQYSGFNAFIALHNVVQNANRLLNDPPAVEVNGVANTITSITGYTALNTPPSNSIQANLIDAAGTGSIIPYISNVSMAATGSFSFTLAMGDPTSPVPTSIEPQLQNAANQPLGFAVFMSNPVQQSQMFIANPEKFAIAYIPNFTLATGTGANVETIQISGGVINADEYQSWVNPYDYVRISVYFTTLNGQMIRIGSMMTQIT